MASSFPDPFDPVRRMLRRAVLQALDRAIVAVQREVRREIRARLRSLAESIEYVTAVLGRMPHGAANIVADSFRGPFSRALTPGEVALIVQAFGTQPVSPGDVRIVLGPGDQPLAAAAFINGNPAITIGNTIYMKPSVYQKLGGRDLSASPEGVEMLLHEYTHVVQYARLGFAVFGKRYAREFRDSGNDAGKMYDYRSRKLSYDQEMIEGQAAIVGDYAQQMALTPAKQNAALIQQLRTKLRGTGIFGQ
ncbi:eCIS core domain-containing protein [Sphingomonas sp. ERG5]|uniref:eCIS core domain-containing protein n=1 Tax=Sphingomonas sp. ERG5 TaxID=1381597 RepID=UPI000A9800E3|nr:DUF4157 domain-containing protein [Sphingomonas sp. ERG5]